MRHENEYKLHCAANLKSIMRFIYFAGIFVLCYSFVQAGNTWISENVKSFDKPVQQPKKDLSPESSAIKDSNACKICEWIVSRYELMINDLVPMFQILVKSFEFCFIYDQEIATQCSKSIVSVGYEVFEAILHKDDPTKVCKLMNVCVNGTEWNHFNYINLIMFVQQPQTTDKCKYCVDIITWNEKYINHNNMPRMDQSYLLDYCGIFKCPFNEDCVRFFSGPGYQVLKDVINKTDPIKVCQYLKVCPPKKSVKTFQNFLPKMIFQ